MRYDEKRNRWTINHLLYTIKWTDSTDGIKECSPGQPAVMGCYVIDINPAALGADTISVTDFRGNVFTMPKKFSGPGSLGKSE